MGFLRRLLGGERTEPRAVDDEPPIDEDAEHQAAIEIVRQQHERLDEFRQRQLRYARWSWRPPRQGGDRRADDGLDAKDASDS